MPLRPLSLLEARVVGVLVEKAHTVPDSYPLSLNSLTLGCNQKTARDPVLNASEAEVQGALDALKSLSLVFEASGSRVSRWEHNVARVLGVPSQSVALLAVLMLRGPQTGSELRANCERLHRFADLSSVEAFLDELAARADDKGGPLVQKLPRAAGAREPRWAHLLSGPVDVSAYGTPPNGGHVAADNDPIAAGEVAALKANQTALRAEIAELRGLVERLYASSASPSPELSETVSMRFELPERKKLTLEMTFPIRWGDMDAMGHVNNTLYFRYFEIARIEWLHRVGGTPDPQGQGPVIVNAFCNFLRQLEYPGDVVARHYVANPGRTSFEAYVTLERADTPGVIYAEGGARTVWVDFPKQKSVPLPDWLRALIE